jgi:hypothetical protein
VWFEEVDALQYDGKEDPCNPNTSVNLFHLTTEAQIWQTGHTGKPVSPYLGNGGTVSEETAKTYFANVSADKFRNNILRGKQGSNGENGITRITFNSYSLGWIDLRVRKPRNPDVGWHVYFVTTNDWYVGYTEGYDGPSAKRNLKFFVWPDKLINAPSYIRNDGKDYYYYLGLSNDSMSPKLNESKTKVIPIGHTQITDLTSIMKVYPGTKPSGKKYGELTHDAN